MKKLLLILLLLTTILFGCAKEPPVQNCLPGYNLSDKYTGDSVFVRTDTIWSWGKNNIFCGERLRELYKAKPQWIFYDPKKCPPPIASLPWFRLECKRIVVGNKITYPKIFKQ